MLLKMQEQGQDSPALRNRPELLENLHYYYDAFSELSSDRSYTQGSPLRLSTGQIHTYWSVYGLYNFEDFADKIKLIDSIWSSKLHEKQEKDSAKKETPKGTRPPQSNQL
jgi:hypothetical protein